MKKIFLSSLSVSLIAICSFPAPAAIPACLAPMFNGADMAWSQGDYALGGSAFGIGCDQMPECSCQVTNLSIDRAPLRPGLSGYIYSCSVGDGARSFPVYNTTGSESNTIDTACAASASGWSQGAINSGVAFDHMNGENGQACAQIPSLWRGGGSTYYCTDSVPLTCEIHDGSIQMTAGNTSYDACSTFGDSNQETCTICRAQMLAVVPPSNNSGPYGPCGLGGNCM